MGMVHPTELAVSWARALPDEAKPLLDPESLTAYAGLGTRLEIVAESYYLECRLERSKQVDLLFAFHRGGTGASSLPGWINARRASASAVARPAWDAARSLVCRWSDDGDPLHDQVSAIWFEFDDVRRAAGEVAPSLSTCVATRYDRDYRAPSGATRGGTAAALVAAHHGLLGALADGGIDDQLRRVVNVLPDGGAIIHLSVMTARDPCAVKVYGVVPTAGLEAFLKSAGWRGPFESLRLLLRDLASPDVCGENVYFDLNLANMGQANACTLGIAFSQQQVVQSSAPPDIARKRLLERLEAHGQCTHRQAVALAAWPAQVTEGLGGWRRASRWFDVKAVLDHSGDVQSKVYLGFHATRSPFVIGG